MSKPEDFRLLCTMQIEDKFIQIQEREWPEGALDDFALAARNTEIAISAKADSYRWLAIVEDDEKSIVAGYAGIRKNGDDHEFAVFVLPDYQGQGLGRLMFGCNGDMARRYRIQSLIVQAPRDSVKRMANEDGFDDAGNGVMRKEIR